MLASRCLRFFLIALAGGAVAQIILPADATPEPATIPSSSTDDNAFDLPPAAEGTPILQLEAAAAAPDYTTTTPAPAAEAIVTITITSAVPPVQPDPAVFSPISPDPPTTTIDPTSLTTPTAPILAPTPAANAADLANLNLDPAGPLATAPSSISTSTRSPANKQTLGVLADDDDGIPIPTTLQTITRRPTIPLYTVPGPGGGAPDVVLPSGTSAATSSGEGQGEGGGGGEGERPAVTPALAFPPTRHWVLPLRWSYSTRGS